MKPNSAIFAFPKGVTRASYIVMLALFLFSFFHLHSQQSAIDSINTKIQNLKKQRPTTFKDTTYVQLLYELGGKYRYISNDSLYAISLKIQEISKQITYDKGEIYALARLGDYYSNKGFDEKSLNYYLEAYKLAHQKGYTGIKLDLFINLGYVYSLLGNYENAFKSYLEGIDLASSFEDKYLEHLSILNEAIANLYTSQKEYKQALSFFKETKKINDKIGDKKIQAETMVGLASVLAEMKQYGHAMFNVNKSIATFEKTKIYDWLAYAYTVKGEIYLDQNNYKWALYWFNQSKMLHENLDDDRARVDLLNGMGNAFLGLGKDSLSTITALEGYDIAKRIKSLPGQKDCAKTLYKVYKKQGDYGIALEFHERYQTISDTLSKNENKRNLTLLKTKLDYDQQKKDLIAENNKVLAKQRNYISITLLVILVLIAGAIPLYFNQKKQKRLYQELKTSTQSLSDREEELKEINKTKDRLFSIIGHDLRGPVGALQGLLRLFSKGDIEMDEFHGFVPKLKADVDHILFTLNNLLSWGYAQMNGSVTRPKVVSINKLVDNSINLLSELAANKGIEIKNELTEKPMGFFDENHIDVVIRNLISNAIKFTPQQGTITIKATEEKKFWRIQVSDTGIGIDRRTQRKLFQENSNVTTYGTNNEKGTGLGLSLCKEMVERNKGKIWVESLPNSGSTFYFTIPKVVKKYRRAS